jgi:hypothetical protein
MSDDWWLTRPATDNADALGAARAEIERLRATLAKIAAIENKQYGPDWEEIDEAREIAQAALAGSEQKTIVQDAHSDTTGWFSR